MRYSSTRKPSFRIRSRPCAPLSASLTDHCSKTLRNAFLSPTSVRPRPAAVRSVQILPLISGEIVTFLGLSWLGVRSDDKRLSGDCRLVAKAAFADGSSAGAASRAEAMRPPAQNQRAALSEGANLCDNGPCRAHPSRCQSLTGSPSRGRPPRQGRCTRPRLRS